MTARFSCPSPYKHAVTLGRALSRLRFADCAWCVIDILLVSSYPYRSEAVDGTYTEYRERDRTWILGNSVIQAGFQLSPDGRFHCRWLRDSESDRTWRAPDGNRSSPI